MVVNLGSFANWGEVHFFEPCVNFIPAMLANLFGRKQALPWLGKCPQLSRLVHGDPSPLLYFPILNMPFLSSLLPILDLQLHIFPWPSLPWFMLLKTDLCRLVIHVLRFLIYGLILPVGGMGRRSESVRKRDCVYLLHYILCVYAPLWAAFQSTTLSGDPVPGI